MKSDRSIVCVTHRALSSGDVAGGEAFLSVAMTEEKRREGSIPGFSNRGSLIPCSPKQTQTFSCLPNTFFFFVKNKLLIMFVSFALFSYLLKYIIMLLLSIEFFQYIK